MSQRGPEDVVEVVIRFRVFPRQPDRPRCVTASMLGCFKRSFDASVRPRILEPRRGAPAILMVVEVSADEEYVNICRGRSGFVD